MNPRAISVGLAALVCVAGAVLAEELGTVKFPSGYRSWYLDHSSVSLQGHTPDNEVGIANVYANELALDGLRTGVFKDGAVLVIDRFQYVEDNNKTLSQGERKAIVVMERDRERFKDTGGWGFEAFRGGDPNRRVVTDGGKFCFACHIPQANNNYLFTKLHQ